MPTLAVVAAIATGVQPANALFVGGTNVLKDDASALYGTPIESIEVVEAGPGGVSSMDMAIDDPTRVIVLGDGMTVLFWDYTNDVPLFRGYVDHWSYEPAFGGQGRIIHVSCTGVEAWLDWAKVTSDPVQPDYPEDLGAAIAHVASANAPQLRAPQTNPADVFTRTGTFAWPIGDMIQADALSQIFQNLDGAPAPTLFGLSVRDAIKALWEGSAIWGPSGNPSDPSPILVTVDFYQNLRVWEDISTLQPEDYTTLTISDTAAGAIAAEGLEYSVEPGDPIRAVYVKGGNSTGTGMFSDGSGFTGRTEIIDDAAILDQVTARSRAVNVMAASAPQTRGSFTLSDFVPVTTVHAGSIVTITDAAAGLSAASFRIFEIRKTFAGTRQTWTIAFGGLPPSGSRLLRKLTRAVSI